MKKRLFILLMIASLTVGACNLGVDVPQDGSAVATAAALTVEAALLSPAASPTQDGPPAGAPGFAPTFTPIPGVAIDGTTAEAVTCEDTAQILTWEREFVPFNKEEADKPLPPGKSFWISLEIKNSGPCLWTHQYRVQFNSGTRLHSGPDTFPFMQTGFSVKPGETFQLSLQLKAPTTPGTYESTYSLINADGKAFLNFGIPTKVGTPSSGNLPAPGDLRYEYSCVPGTVTITLKWTDNSNNEEGFRIYRDGTKVTDLPAGATQYDDVLSLPGSYSYTVAAFNSSGEAGIDMQAETSNCN